MLHQDLAGTLPIKGYSPRQHFVQDDPRRVDVDLLVVIPRGDLRGHVVDRSHALRLGRPLAAADELAQAIIADLDVAVFQENVGRLEVTMDDAVIVEVANGLGQGQEPLLSQLLGQPLGMTA